MRSFAFLLAFALGCASPAEEPASEPGSIEQLFEDFHHFRLRSNPLEATKLGEPGYDDRIANFISDEYALEVAAEYERFLARIDELDVSRLSEADRTSLAVMRWDCALKLEGLSNELATVTSPLFNFPVARLLPVAQIFSLHLYVSQLASGSSVHPFETVEDYDNWLARLDDYVVWIDSSIANMRAGMARGIVWPKVLVEKAIPQIDDLLAPDLESHIYHQPIANLPADIAAQDARRLREAFARAIGESVDPAHRRLRNFLADEYLPVAGDHTGIGALPGGKEAYRHLIRYHTSTDLGAEEIHALGLREVERISREMRAIQQALDIEGDLRAFFDHVRSNPALLPFSTPEEVLANFDDIHARMRPRLAELFDITPEAGFEVRRTEAFRELSASAEYVPGSRDGSRPGVFYVPVPDASAHNVFSDEALFLHEAIPGHHYQLSLQQENPNLPAFLLSEGIGVYVEGWALYSESLGRELGLYEDPYQLFGMLSMEMHRAIRLVVDTGMHSKGWTREQAIQYSLDHEAESEAGITAEIERYMAGPGQALAYKIGQLKIRELRTRAEEALGERFDLADFHTEVLDSGSLPLVLLEEKIERWIASY